MQVARYLGARTICTHIARTGIVEADYQGAMTQLAFATLRTESLRKMPHAAGFVVRLDRALIAMGRAPTVCADSYPADAAPGALIVRPDQYELWVAYAAQAAQHGVMRSVWLDSMVPLALQWVERQVAAARSRSPA